MMQQDHHEVVIDEEKCIGCGLCARICVASNIRISDRKAHVVLKECLLCGHCFAVCPRAAVSISGYDEPQDARRTPPRLDAEEVLDVIRFRRSIRRFKKEPVAHGIVERILEAGRLTHTAKNAQDVSFIVLDKEKARIESMAVSMFRAVKPVANLFSPLARNSEIGDDFFFFGAPIVIVIAAKDKANGILAAQNMEFVAEASGLGVLYSGYFTAAANVSRAIRKALGVPRGKKVAMALVLGYPDVEFVRPTPHRPLDVQYR